MIIHNFAQKDDPLAQTQPLCFLVRLRIAAIFSSCQHQAGIELRSAEDLNQVHQVLVRLVDTYIENVLLRQTVSAANLLYLLFPQGTKPLISGLRRNRDLPQWDPEEAVQIFLG